MATSLELRLKEFIEGGLQSGNSVEQSVHWDLEGSIGYIHETNVALALVRDYLPLLHPGARILEVGAGLGIFSHFLAELGFDVVALEPCADGFDQFSQATQEILTWRTENKLPHAEILPARAEELNKKRHGTFDFIFSVNVLEHIRELEQAFDGIDDVLADKGCFVATCPNYRIPYEPHFGIPILWSCRRINSVLFRKTLQSDWPLWQSLNFIGPTRLDRITGQRGLKIDYKEGIMAATLERFQSDRVFRERHRSSLIGTCLAWGLKLGLAQFARHIPARWATPIVFEIQRLDTARVAASSISTK